MAKKSATAVADQLPALVAVPGKHSRECQFRRAAPRGSQADPPTRSRVPNNTADHNSAASTTTLTPATPAADLPAKINTSNLAELKIALDDKLKEVSPSPPQAGSRAAAGPVTKHLSAQTNPTPTPTSTRTNVDTCLASAFPPRAVPLAPDPGRVRRALRALAPARGRPPRPGLGQHPRRGRDSLLWLHPRIPLVQAPRRRRCCPVSFFTGREGGRVAGRMLREAANVS